MPLATLPWPLCLLATLCRSALVCFAVEMDGRSRCAIAAPLKPTLSSKERFTLFRIAADFLKWFLSSYFISDISSLYFWITSFFGEPFWLEMKGIISVPQALKVKLQTSTINTHERPCQFSLILHQVRTNMTQIGYFWAHILILWIFIFWPSVQQAALLMMHCFE